MFFAASKILYFLIRPMNWVLALLVVAWRSKTMKWKNRCTLAALAILVLGSNRALLNTVARWWEPKPFSAQGITSPYDVGILLGGFSNSYGWPVDGRFHVNVSANRLTQTLELYFQGKIKKILITGGWSRVLGTPKGNEARETYTFLVKSGIPEGDIIVESQARNTWENAWYSKQLLRQRPDLKRMVLITSAWHMPRSRACFRKAGLNPDIYCVDYLQNQSRLWWEDLIKFEPDTFQKWEWLIKEWVGIIAYKVKGYN